jgi:TonB family protein
MPFRLDGRSDANLQLPHRPGRLFASLLATTAGEAALVAALLVGTRAAVDATRTRDSRLAPLNLLVKSIESGDAQAEPPTAPQLVLPIQSISSGAIDVVGTLQVPAGPPSSSQGPGTGGGAGEECTVTIMGTCADTHVVRSLDRRFELDEAALRAAQEWRFRPARRKTGEPVPMVVSIAIAFIID